jgi:hypothetical protein
MLQVQAGFERVKLYTVTELDVVQRVFKVEYVNYTRDQRLLTFRTVRILDKTCTCGCWQDSALPGVHPLAVFQYLK